LPGAAIREQPAARGYSVPRAEEEISMGLLQKLSRLIDALNEFVGRWIYWLVLIVVLESAGNAIVRKIFNSSSNALLEMQWYLFSAIFLLAAGYTLLHNEHVRIDIIQSRLSPRAQAWVDIFGLVFFLGPMVLVFIWLSWPWFLRTYLEGEISGSAGGLILWPARLLVPIGFMLLALQGLSELIKRVAFLAGKGPDPIVRHDSHAAEQEMVEEMRRIAEART
jgi:TRAP-type mannitol/chloroaromatic compound transport system permease small subunit